MFSAGQMRPCREAYWQPSDSLKIKIASVEPQPDIKSQCISSSSDLFPLCSNTFTTCSISIKPLFPLFRMCLFPLNWWTMKLYCQSLGMQLSEVMSIRSDTLGVPVFPSDFRILVIVPEGPAALLYCRWPLRSTHFDFRHGFSQTGPPDFKEIQQEIVIMLFFCFLV